MNRREAVHQIAEAIHAYDHPEYDTCPSCAMCWAEATHLLDNLPPGGAEGRTKAEQWERMASGEAYVTRPTQPQPVQVAAEVERSLRSTLRLRREVGQLIDHARADDEPWFPKVLVVTDESQHRDHRGVSVDWARADIVVTPDGTVLKNKYGPTGWTDWRS